MAKKSEHTYNNFFTKEKWAKVNPENKAIIKDYEEEMKQKQRKQSTITQYKADWRIVLIKVMEMFNNKCLVDLKKKEWRRLSLYFKEECNHSNARINRLLSATRSLMNYVEEDDEYDYDNSTISKVRGLPKQAVREIYFLTDEQILAIKEELLKREEYQKATVMMLAYDSAGRKNELHQVMKASFYDDKQSVTNTVIGKRGKEFELVYFSGTKECAKLYLEQRGEDDIDEMWVTFEHGKAKPIDSDTIYAWFKYMVKILEEIEGEEIPFSPHSFRHSSLENLSQDVHSHYALIEVGRPEGLTLEELQAHANHSSSEITSSYLKDRTAQRKLSMFNLLKEDDE